MLRKAKFILILALAGLSSCGSQAVLVSEDLEEISELNYFAPVYSFQDSVIGSRSAYNYVEYTNHKIDSLFEIKENPWRVSGKVRPKDTQSSLKIIQEINGLVELAKSSGSIEGLEIPSGIDSAMKSHPSKYYLVIQLEPDFITAGKKYGSSVVSGHSNLFFKKNYLYLLLLDSELKKVVYYSRSRKDVVKGLSGLEHLINREETSAQ